MHVSTNFTQLLSFCPFGTGSMKGFPFLVNWLARGKLVIFVHVWNNCYTMSFTINEKQREQLFRNYLMSANIKIKEIMKSKPISQENNYLSFLQPTQILSFNLVWAFKPTRGGYYVVEVTPETVGPYGTPLKIKNQRMQVDFLRQVLHYSLEKSVWKILLNQNHEVYLQFILPFQQICLRKDILNSRKRQSIEIISYLTDKMKQYGIQTFSQTPLAKNLQKTSLINIKFLTQQSFKQQIMPYGDNAIHKDFEKIINQSKKEQPKQDQTPQIAQNIQNIMLLLNLQGITTPIELIHPHPNNFFLPYDQTELNKQQTNKKKLANVLGVESMTKIHSQSKNYPGGTHSQLKKQKFKLVLLISVNQEVSKYLEQKSNEKAQYQVNPLEKKKYKIIQKFLMQKFCNQNDKIQSKNSFINEHAFVYFLKPRSCQYIATYYLLNKHFSSSEEYLQQVKNEPIIMDCYSQSLREIIDQPPFLISFRERLKIIYNVNKGLQWLNNENVCHRDIKPENILLDSDLTPKIIDFGSCCNIFNTDDFQPAHTKILTTLSYSRKLEKNSPLSKSRHYTQQYYNQHFLFDVHSLGKVMQEMFSDRIDDETAVGDLLGHLCRSCIVEAVQDRPTYVQINVVLMKIMEYQIKLWRQKNSVHS